MQEHYWEKATGYEVKISKGFSDLKESAYTASEPDSRFPSAARDKSNMAKYLFGGFKRCLYPVQKFQSDAERNLAVILEREAQKWFKPAKGQFQIYYNRAATTSNTSPTSWPRRTPRSTCWSPRKRRDERRRCSGQEGRGREVVQAGKRPREDLQRQAVEVCLIPHDAIAENMTLEWLAAQFGVDEA